VRSQLHVPGGTATELTSAAGHGADAVVVDLAAVPDPDELVAAREEAAGWLRDGPGTSVWVRINEGADGVRDARAVTCSELTGVVVVGAESATGLAALAVELAEAEEQLNLPIGTVRVAPEIGSAAGLLAAAQLARAPRVGWLGIDERQLCADLGVEPGPDERELLWLRSRVVTACAAAGIAAPIGAVCAEVDDLAALREHTVGLRRLGFQGRACLHPAQLPVVHEVFGTPVPVSPVVA
jgi:citrate lyase subunit beta/citryl-CoA lyase